MRKSAALLYLNGVGVSNNASWTPCMFTLIYYIGVPYFSPGVHWFLHCITVALRFVLDHNLKVNEADTSMLGLVWRMEDVTRGWLTMLAFPLALAVFDRRGFWALMPRPVRNRSRGCGGAVHEESSGEGGRGIRGKSPTPERLSHI